MKKNKQPHILIIYTGGTIGMIEDEDSRKLLPFDFSHLIDNVPKIKMLDYIIDNIQFNPPIDSSEMNPSHWVEIARAIDENYEIYDGFVVLHGTDTMAYTASALSYMLGNLSKPVIITGSQLPIGEVRTDGEENLITALQIAAAREINGQPMIQEVAILFEDYLWRGNRATKMSSDNFNAFKSNNYPSLAKIGLGIHFNDEALRRMPIRRRLHVQYQLDTSVMFFTIFPGITREVVHHVFTTPGIKGIVMKTFGAGNAFSDEWFVEEIKDAIGRGVVIVNVSQCISGGVGSSRYPSSDVLTQAGVVFGHDITDEAAITKLMYLFGQGLTPSAVRYAMEYSIAGEVTV
ncbi:MAG: asparaginase [Muribaculaceae bacterium]|nr:asparaginase [Muribaculaceae bacterium]MBR5435309.1 asparaginase [Muribaculaceae bacterium]MBR5743769.1 asparaginase [Muribaculaceae bacterium]